MGDGEFVAELSEREPSSTGADDVTFLIRPNAGLPLAPVAQTASGGELSRIALAIAAVGGGATMIFDEIDAGIGGQTAHAVADTLVRLAERAQVVTITHLPQIASRADRHFSVEKVPGDPDAHTHPRAHRRRAPCGDRAYARRARVPLRGCRRREWIDTYEMPTRSLIRRSKKRAPAVVELTGRARLDRRTKHLVRRLKPDDVAIIDHADLDRVSAEELVESGVRVVVNVSPSSTGQFPNLGPLTLLRGGVRLVDAPGAPLFEQLTDGEWVTVRGGSVFRNGDRLATGRVLDELELLHALDEQQARLADAISKFADNTMRYLREEGRLLAEGVDFPALETRFRDRHCLVVARGPGHKHDLRIVRGYIRNFKPVLVGVDGGADALREAGYTPDVIVGDMDSVTDETLACGAELVVHAYPSSGDAPGAERAERLGLEYHAVPALGISEDVALLARLREGRRADRRRRHALQPGRVSRAEPRGHVVDVHGAAARGGDPRRRERRLAARQRACRRVAARDVRGSRAGGDSRSDRRVAGPADLHPGARRAPLGSLRHRLSPTCPGWTRPFRPCQLCRGAPSLLPAASILGGAARMGYGTAPELHQ